MAFSEQHLYFDDVQIGQEWESPGRTVTQADIVNFAGLSGDFNPIHIDHEFCKNTPYRQPIAHGLLVFSIGSGLGSAFGSWSGGLIHDATHGYNALLAFALASVVLGMIPFLVVPALRR